MSLRWAALGLAAAYTAAHLPFLAPSLEDIDSINFALGLRDFDVALHQPHPPGSPVYIALGHIALAIVRALGLGGGIAGAEALALAGLSALAGGIGLYAVWMAFRDVSGAPSLGVAAVVAVAPLFWMSGLRPLSDLPGLAAALVAQALLLEAITGASDDLRSPKGPRRALAYGALVAGLAIGLRTQTMWLTMPLLLMAVLAHAGEGVWWMLSRPLAGLVIGGLAWLIPLLALSGGVGGYLAALGTQAGEDFAWVDMLWANPTPRRLAFTLYETFVLPWGSVPLATVVHVAAAAGAGAAWMFDRRSLTLLAVAFAPYALFHLLLQESFTVRYSLPLLVPVAWLAVRGLALLGRYGLPVATAALVLVAGVHVWRGMEAYSREVHPAFAAIEHIDTTVSRRALAGAPPFGGVYAHYALRRPVQAAPPRGVAFVEPRRGYEWLDLVEYWRQGGRNTVWFLADPRRTDLALIDPQARRNVRRFQWAVGTRPELTGSRPLGVDLYAFEPPGWFAGEGWSLTPEVGGMTRAAGSGLDRGPIAAFVRRTAGPMHLVVGGYHLGSANDPPVVFTLAIDDAVADSWTFDPSQEGRNFLRFVQLPSGVSGGGGAYARLTVAGRPLIPGRPMPAIAIRQFDIQPESRLLVGYGEGWHEEEYENRTGLRWRWTSERSVLRVQPPQALRISLRGESPLRYFDAPPRVRVTAAGREIASLQPDDDFEWTVTVPADAVAAAGGAIAIETDPVYLPGEAEGTADARRLGLRLFDVSVHPVDP